MKQKTVYSIEEALALRYTDVNSHHARKFAKELAENDVAGRNVSGSYLPWTKDVALCGSIDNGCSCSTLFIVERTENSRYRCKLIHSTLGISTYIEKIKTSMTTSEDRATSEPEMLVRNGNKRMKRAKIYIQSAVGQDLRKFEDTIIEAFDEEFDSWVERGEDKKYLLGCKYILTVCEEIEFDDADNYISVPIEAIDGDIERDFGYLHVYGLRVTANWRCHYVVNDGKEVA